MTSAKIDTAIILAAGVGSKFWPYNVVRQKAAFPIANIPAVRRTAEALHALGIHRTIVVVGYGEASVRAALHGCPGQVTYVRQPQPTGTAAALLLAADGLTEDFLVVAGDLVTDPQNIVALLNRFGEEHSPAAALIQPLGLEKSESWISAFPEQGYLKGVEGHSRGGAYRLGGVYAFRPVALDYLRANPGIMTQVPVGGMPPLEAEIAQSIGMMIDAGQTVLAVETLGYHIDLDKPWHIDQANETVINAMRATVQE
ncbi:MAG: NTP transferase domain-containing protein, partial [Chloroflexota bacterium]|nr:NTP transferase domain-containing protein [Chloroflexota bacterium]